MPKTISDLKEREQALRPELSFIVQAPAGSGKTELLIQRYLRLLGQVEFPEEIVAITFTRKAAAEMQGRIINALERARSHQASNKEAIRVTNKLAHTVLAQDQKHNWQLETNPNRLRIQTIDALCARLTRQMPILSNFGAQPETVENASELYQEAAGRALAELESDETWSDSIAVLLTHLDNDLPRIRNMLAMMLARRDQWLRHVTSELRRGELEDALKHIVESTLGKARQAFPEILIDELLTCLRFAADNLLKEGKDSPIGHCPDLDQLPCHAMIDLTKWRGIVELLFTGKSEWRKQANAAIGFPAASGNKAESDKRKAMKDRFAALLVRLAEHENLYAQLLDVQSLPEAVYTETEWQVVNALCQLLILADAQLRVLFAERHQIDFSGIELAAIQALGNQEAPSDLALHLDYNIKHILVDEFQDISINQYVLVQQLTAGWSVNDGHTLFLVGDPMQSIYRFREAEVSLFLNTWQQRRLGQVALTPLSITVNFRSQTGIVEWVNETFKQVLPQVADISRGAVTFEAAKAFNDVVNDHAVTLHSLLDCHDQIEAEKVLQIVNKTRQHDPEGKIAILVRARSHLYEIVPCLKRAGLRFRAVEIESLSQQPAIQDLLALTRALTHFADRIAWLATLRAPWCGLTLIDLLVLAGNAKDKTIWELMQDVTRIQALSKDGQQRLFKLREVLQQAFKEQRRRSLRRWVESVWIQIGGPATLQDDTALENTDTFFELIDKFDVGGDLKDRDQFMEQVMTLYAAADVQADDRLQIMTIHKAKGLEFDTVILPGLSHGSRADETSLLLWMENPHDTHQDLLLAPVKEAGEKGSPIYDYVKRLEKEKKRYEEGRLLYVAATRAKMGLHLIGTVNVKEKNNELVLADPPSNSLLHQLWTVVQEDYERALKTYQPHGHREDTGDIAISNQLRRLSSGWLLPDPPKAVQWQPIKYAKEIGQDATGVEFEWASETIMHVGSVVHRCIQLIAEEGIDTWNEVRIQSGFPYYELLLKRLGVPEKELGWASQGVQEALTRLINDERGQWILNGGYEIQENEYPVSGIYQGKLVNIIIDRTFVDEDGVRWVVDYKTSRHEGPDVDTFLDQEQERYQAQLEKYGALIKALDARPVRLGLYFPLLQGWKEWAYTTQ